MYMLCWDELIDKVCNIGSSTTSHLPRDILEDFHL
uniref:Uncharacterized protein n=1 Tax=Arundo donax TaxID=35708 RepID=A0A0A9GPM6_ARUDO